MWRIVRVALLSVVLVVAAGVTWLDRASTRDWDRTLWVGLYALNADGSGTVDAYIAQLDAEAFASIPRFIAREAQRHGVRLAEPVRIVRYPSPAAMPPALAPDANALQAVLWSLRMRFYAWRAPRGEGQAPPNIRVFVAYHDPARTMSVPHSLGLQKGLVGVVHAFAARDMTEPNAVVIAHELLHTLGATDKYDFETLLPQYPEGYAEPNSEPRWPQAATEIMAGRRALSATEAEMPEGLDEVVVGDLSAREIGWRTQ